MDHVPVIDVHALVDGAGDPARAAARIDAACRDAGFFAITGHGIDPDLPARLAAAAREFFALDADEKARVAMAEGGRAWRGWFPLGGELTSGVPDRKEGYYFGAELTPDDPRVVAGTPMHGPNLFPERPPGLRALVLEYLDRCTALAHAVTRGISMALGLEPAWLRDHYFADPLVLLRVFRYPPLDGGEPAWSVGEHTDYGFLTLLWQDDRGGLEVRVGDRWVDVDPIPDAFVCNLGDMLDRLTGGTYRSTPHRVRNRSEHDRISIPFFFDPGWDARISALPGTTPTDDAPARWDRADVHAFEGTYGDYVFAKVAKVFPALHADI